jgi:ABC-type uncharacterized transport system involved in gliding motility auxiliary subunit
MSFQDKVKPHLDRAKAAAEKLPVDKAKRAAKSANDQATAAAGKLSRGTMIGAGVALAIVLFLAVNVISSNTFRNARADLTSNNLYSLTNGTRELLANLEEPLHLRLFMSSALTQSAPQLSNYANRVEAMLSTYASLSNGKITLEVIDPEPFSDAEDRAVGFGINRIRISGAPQELFFGLAATNSTDGRGQIPVFSPDREAFLEYDLTRLIAELGQPQKPVIAVVDGIAMSGNPMARQPEQQILKQLKELFTVEQISGDLDKLPDGTRVVMVVHPRKLSERTLYTIDQWVLNGGATMVFVDPNAELAPGLRPGMPPMEPASDFDKLLAAWGVKFNTAQAVGDPQTAIRTVREVGGRAVEATNLPWLSLRAEDMAKDDAALAQISSIIMTTAGSFTTTSDATKLKPLMTASNEAGYLDARAAGDPKSDPRLLYTQLQKADAKPILAARLSGALKTAFPDGKPDGSEATGEPLKTVKGQPNVILVGDADMVMDRNWIRQRQVMGQVIAQAFANNGAFILNAVEQMVGGTALADLRGRGVSTRPFEKIEAIAKAAEAQYLQRQQALVAKLQQTEQRINQLSQQGGDNGEVLSEETQKAVEQFRSELLSTRAELRNVQLELRRDVDSLQTWLTAINVGIVPALVAALALGFALRRPKRPLPTRTKSDTAQT